MTDKNIEIYTIHFNMFEFLDIQLKTFSHFIKQNINVNVVLDTNPANNQINLYREYCKSNNINLIEFNSWDGHVKHDKDAGALHSNMLNHIWQNYVIHDDKNYSMVCDGDMFCIKKFDLIDYLEGKYKITCVAQHRSNNYHLSPQLGIYDISLLENPQEIRWDLGFKYQGDSYDVGGKTLEYLKTHENDKFLVKFMDQRGVEEIPEKYRTLYESDLEFYANSSFLHYLSGSGWRNEGQEYHKNKLNFIINLLDYYSKGQLSK